MIHIRKINEDRAVTAGNRPEWQRITSAVARYMLLHHDGVVINRKGPGHEFNSLRALEYIKRTLNYDHDEAMEVLDGTADLSINDIVKLIGIDGFHEVMSDIK